MKTELRKIRESRGLTLRGLGKEAGIAFSRISRHERRLEKLYPRDVLRYCEALGVEPEAIRGADGLARLAEGESCGESYLVTKKLLDDGLALYEGGELVGWFLDSEGIEGARIGARVRT